MPPNSHEYRLTFPIGVDKPGEGTPIPITMKRYKMQGTPSSVLIGRDGRIRHHGFGQEDDMALGMLIGSLLAEKVSTKPPATLDKQLTGAAGAEQGPVLP